MRYRLQYLYSILVFFGVLACSFFLVSRESGSAIPFRTIEAPPMRAEASPLDPGVTKLFEAESAMKYEQSSKRDITKSSERKNDE